MGKPESQWIYSIRYQDHQAHEIREIDVVQSMHGLWAEHLSHWYQGFDLMMYLLDQYSQQLEK